MGSRKKDPAVLRMLDIFTRKTPLETAEDMANEEARSPERPAGPRDLVEEAEEGAIRWLGLDVFHEGDDIKVAVHRAGHAALVLVSVNASGPYGTSTIKLSRSQWAKLKRLAST